MRIALLSDLHTYLPEVGDCDLLLLAGDYCPGTKYIDQYWWLKETFSPWLEQLSSRMKIVGIAGNHDFAFEKNHYPQMSWTYLQDSGTEFSGLKIYGVPWQTRYYDWAFNLDAPELAIKFAQVPDDTDILVTHGPPWGYGDGSRADIRLGAPSLTERIFQIQPKLVVCGHIHPGRGVYQAGETKVVNAAYVDNVYKPYNPGGPIYVDL